MRFIAFVFLIAVSQLASAQQIEERINKTYYSKSDTIRYKYSAYPQTFDLVLGKHDSISPGTDVAKGIVMTAFIGKDTLVIAGNSFPFSRRTYVTIQTPTKKTVVIFRYNAIAASFSQDYIEENEGKISYEIPEVYELANIIWTLSPNGKAATDLQKNTDYYKRVEKYFSPFLNHPIFKRLNFEKPEEVGDKYYEFRENSFIYNFDGDKIMPGGKHNFVYGSDWEAFTNLFTELLPLVQDFADQSKFREFYAKNKGFYATDLKRVEEVLPVRNMWTWLEKEFPAKHDAYKIVLSPLIGGSHSTQHFVAKNQKKDAWYSETVMFICDANRYDIRKELSEAQKSGLMSGVVFTEIDHNYINSVSSKYRKQISEIYSSKIWTDDKSSFYKNPMSVFNEYMTHAAFCIWVLDNFDQKASDLIMEERVKMNRDKRGFVKFDEFNTALIKLKKDNKGKTLAMLYPDIIAWSKKFSETTGK